MILTYHQAIELMSYLPMALPEMPQAQDHQSELAQVHQNQSDLQMLVINAGMVDTDDDEMLYSRKTA